MTTHTDGTTEIIGHDKNGDPVYDLRCECKTCKHNGKGQLKKCFLKQCKCCIETKGHWASIHKEVKKQ